MVRIELLASDCVCANVFEEIDRDTVVREMVLSLSSDYLGGRLTDTVLLRVSFFGGDFLREVMERLQGDGTLGLCGFKMGCTRVLEITFKPASAPLFVQGHSE